MFVSKKKYNKLLAQLQKSHDENEKLLHYAFIVGIEREGRVNKFIFMRDNKLIQIETMGLISDDLPKWKKELLNTNA